MKFICKNLDCEGVNKEEEFYNNSKKFIDGALVSVNAPCPICGQMREEVGNNTPLSQKNIAVGKYSSASPEDRKKMLQQRAHNHFKKEVEPYKKHRLDEAVTQFSSIK